MRFLPWALCLICLGAGSFAGYRVAVSKPGLDIAVDNQNAISIVEPLSKITWTNLPAGSIFFPGTTVCNPTGTPPSCTFPLNVNPGEYIYGIQVPGRQATSKYTPEAFFARGCPHCLFVMPTPTPTVGPTNRGSHPLPVALYCDGSKPAAFPSSLSINAPGIATWITQGNADPTWQVNFASDKNPCAEPPPLNAKSSQCTVSPAAAPGTVDYPYTITLAQSAPCTLGSPGQGTLTVMTPAP